MTTLVVLLRGINVGRHKRVKMADLRALLEDAGYRDVRTLLQSGNVVLATDEDPGRAVERIEATLAERLGFAVDVVVRTGEELAAVVAANPLGDIATDGSRHFVVFLSHAPEQGALAALESREFAPERWVARGRELFLWCPAGVQDSLLMKAATDLRGGPTATARNWNTVTKLLDLVRAA